MDKHIIYYTVNGNQQSAEVTERTATEILEIAGNNPSQRFLIEIKGEHRKSFHGPPAFADPSI